MATSPFPGTGRTVRSRGSFQQASDQKTDMEMIVISPAMIATAPSQAISASKVSRMMMSLAQNPESGARDSDTLRLIPAYRGFAHGKHVEFGVYADVEEPGRVRVGDPVEPL